MTEQKTNSNANAEDDAIQSVDASSDNEAAVTNEPVNEKAPKHSAVLWLALILTWGAMAAAAYWVYGEYQSLLQSVQAQDAEEPEVVDYGSIIDARMGQLKSELVSSLQADDGELNSRLNDVALQLKQLPEIHQQLNHMSSRVERAVRTSDESWQLAEIEYLLSLAQQRAMLGAEPEMTVKMLDAAADGLAKIDEVSTISVRQAIEDDKLRLRSLPQSDRVQHFMQLAALQNRIGDLAFESVKSKLGDSNDVVSDTGDGTTSERFMAYLDSVIKVRSSVPPKPLRTPDQEQFLRQILLADFKTMQWAILHGEQTVFESARDSAREWLSWGFDVSAPLVIQFDKTLSEFDELDVSDVKAVSLQSMAAFKAFQLPTSNEGE